MSFAKSTLEEVMRRCWRKNATANLYAVSDLAVIALVIIFEDNYYYCCYGDADGGRGWVNVSFTPLPVNKIGCYHDDALPWFDGEP